MSEMKSYEYESGGRILCKSHNMLRCGECAYVEELEEENEVMRNALRDLDVMAERILFERHAIYTRSMPDVAEHIVNIITEAERKVGEIV